MKKFLYHGSIVPNITELSANSKSHHSDERVLYLTDSFPYSLFYIWDKKHNFKNEKHVTCWIKNGIVYYEEQFENQLKRFYDGVSGYVYIVKNSENFIEVSNRESMWYSLDNMYVSKIQYIANVYEEVQKQVAEGKVKIITYDQVDKHKLDAIYEYITSNRIINNKLLDNPECDDAVFYRTFFSKAWDAAKNKRE